MTPTAVVPPLVKEVRALAPPWIACLACMFVPAIADSSPHLGGLAVSAYFVGAAALGGLSIGHEYTGRTLNLLLSLPAQRSRLFAIKLAVLAMLQLALAGAAYTLVLGDARLPQMARGAAALVPALGGLFLAPWLTMACRSAIGGAVFALGIPGALVVMGELIGTSLYGQSFLMETFRLTFVWFGTLAICVVGAVMGWRTFLRLEVIDGPAEHVSLARWWRSSTSAQTATRVTRRRPIVLLGQKELHLQALPLAVAVIFVLMWIVVVWGTTWASNAAYGAAIFALTILYGGMLPLLIGVSAGAGERQLGTLEWQITQPMSMSKQWWIKIAIVLGLSLVLALGLPMLLMYLADLTRVTGDAPFTRPDWSMVLPVMLLASGGLYVSSLTSGALWGLVMSVPAAIAASAFLRFLWFRVGSSTYRMVSPFAREMTPGSGLGPVVPFWIVDSLIWVGVAGFIGVVLWLALQNHRSADRSLRRVCIQLLLLAACAVAGVICVSTTMAFLAAMNRPPN